MQKLFTKNKNGFRINMCCASCGHKDVKDSKLRICRLSNQDVDKEYYCPAWKMAGIFEDFVEGMGRVKKKAYLEFILDARSKSNQTVEEMREEWKSVHGDIYESKL